MHLNNIGEKIHKNSNILKCNNFNDVYHEILSNWSNPSSIVIGSNEQNSIFNNYFENFKGLMKSIA